MDKANVMILNIHLSSDKTELAMEKNDVEKIMNFWVQTSDDDYSAMKTMFDSKSYNWALFIGHIVIEKLLKSVVVKVTAKHAPFTHNLITLSELSELDFSKEQLDWIETITNFNLNARYDNYKRQFYFRCDRSYAIEWIDKIESLRSWIKSKHFQ